MDVTMALLPTGSVFQKTVLGLGKFGRDVIFDPSSHNITLMLLTLVFTLL